MISFLNSCYSRFDGALGSGDEKKNKITTPFLASPVKISALGVLGVILFFFALAGPTPAMAANEPFGLHNLEVSAVNRNGSPDAQAGSHPYALVTAFRLNKQEEIEIKGSPGEPIFRPSGEGLKDVRFQLPPGFVGNPDATPKCGYQEFAKKECPNDTAIGVATTILSNPHGEEFEGKYVDKTVTVSNPVYNVETPGAAAAGLAVAAEFGYYVAHTVPVFLDASVRTGSDYGITENARNITQTEPVLGTKVTIWGVPAEASHNKLRGDCLAEDQTYGPAEAVHKEESEREREEELGYLPGELTSPAECPVNVPVAPLLTNPTSCGEPREASMSIDDWEEPGNFATEPGNLPGEKVHTLSATLPALSGCEKLDFSPSIAIEPDGTAGSTPMGLNVDVHVPQKSSVNPEGLGEADVRDTTVTLPPGVQLSPSAADGRQACSPAQIGFERYEELDKSGVQTPIFAAKLYNKETEKEEATLCPDASKIANVKIKTPLLEGELEGSVYLAAPQNFSLASGAPLENPFSSLIAMYLVAEEPATGVLVKLAGHVELGESNPNPPSNGLQPGQIRTVFENTPQLPYSDLKLEFYGTDRAPLATPAVCGAYYPETSMTPWSATNPANPVEIKHPPSEFRITSGPEVQTGSGPQTTGCANPLPFAPSLASETTNIQAGAFSPLETTLSREDGQQSIQQVTLHYPAGLSGLLSGVKLCGEAEANAGTCGSESLIGETIVSVGLGNDPFSVTGGKVYITGPYEGAPFGLSIVNPAKAGPFNLQEGRPVVVRATISVDPYTAALTVTTNTAAQGYAIPNIIDGIPLQIKHVYVAITRSGFTFNPTGCNAAQVTGTVASAEGASSPVSIPFQVTNCAQLKFEPKLTVSTQARTSKADGASLTYKVTYPSVPFGTDANIHYVKVELPSELPSRLTTLQKACTQTQFQSNPAGCPAASNIGHAKAVVPNIPVSLEGPVYFVSNGGEAFPNLVMVLQGYGVTIDLIGDTLIKNGVTSTTFNRVPDNPLTSFEIDLPEGPYSALAANGNLCKPTVTKVVKTKQRLEVKGKMKTVIRRLKQQVPAPLDIPSDYIGQNNAVYSANVPISVTGCPKAKVAKKKRVVARKRK
jgi:hypothetical protein